MNWPGVDRALEILSGSRATVLTGAGLSTDSGIPDYRSPGAPRRSSMTFQDFMGSEGNRQRYWARNLLGYAQVRQAEPNAGHHALAQLERAGAITGLITQNVDRLHEAAGSENVVDLHGRIDQIVCMSCRRLHSRPTMDRLMDAANPDFAARAQALGVEYTQDGDANIDPSLISGFSVPPCPACAGILKPDFVFFGENVPRPRVERAYAMVHDGGALLVAGTSLSVMSGLRFVRRAREQSKAVVIVNRGWTRGDELASVKIEASVSDVLEHFAAVLLPASGPATSPGTVAATRTGSGGQ